MKRLGLLLVLAGCADGEVALATLTLTLPEGAVIDPKGEGDPSLSIEGGEDCALSAHLESPVGQVRDLEAQAGAALRWDGLDEDGLPFDPGPVAVLVDCGGASAATRLWVLRLGIEALDLDSGDDGGNVTLAYHKLGARSAGVTAIEVPEYASAPADGTALSSLDEDDGAARGPVAPWTEAGSPPWGEGSAGALAYNLPAAFVAGSLPRLYAVGGEWAVSPRTGAPVPALGAEEMTADLPALRLLAEGFSSEPVAYLPGETLRFDADEALPSTLGEDELSITWRWQSETDAGWLDVPGTQTTTHSLWRLVGPTALADGSALGFARPLTWVGALAALQGALQGVPADSASALDAIRDALYEDPYVIYNPNDAAYSTYSGSYIFWDYIWSDLSGWLDRQDGIELYCHSMSCLLSVLAGHWGVYAEQEVLGVGFYTNLTCAAGTDTWRRWSFNSHSVASPDGGATIWDAAVNFDGDADPTQEPATATSPKGLPYAEYLALLTPDDISIVNQGQCYFE